ncbi:MAG: sensor histidine kinase [Bacteriovoracia bacterium]
MAGIRKFFTEGVSFYHHLESVSSGSAISASLLLSDALIGVACTFIAINLFRVLKKNHSQFSFLIFGVFFILAHGLTHLADVATYWVSAFWLSTSLKFIAAFVSVGTAIWLLPFEKQLKTTQLAYRLLEERVQERTSELQKANKTLKQTEKELIEAIRTRDEFLSIASHELKTPITSLSLQIQMTKKNIKPEVNEAPSPEKLSRVFDISDKQISRLTNLVEDLLDISRIRSGRMFFNFERVNLSELVSEMVSRLSDQLQKASCPVTCDIQNGVYGSLDHTRIEQIIDNILSNTIKYAPGSPVFISLKADGNIAKLIVKDEGPGIPEDKQANIFERFSRAVTSKEAPGLGLGLYIVSEIVKGHKGEIELKSSVGNGASFMVSLPIEEVVEQRAYGQRIYEASMS